jgi:hypothetical protein
MLQQAGQAKAREVEWSCQAVSPMDDACEAKASYHCGICGQWFCAAHAEDEAWHPCVLEPGEEGGEG